MSFYNLLQAPVQSVGHGIPTEWVLLIVIGVVGILIQAKLQSVFRKFSKIPFAGGMTGRDVAEKMLRDNGITNVRVISTHGVLTDHYNPRDNTINLSEGVYSSASVAAAAVAAHETGHAIQHSKEYAPLQMRSALVPVITFTSRWVMLVIIAGLFMINTFPELFWIGIAMIGVSAIFSLITLPVEFNASARAMQWLRDSRTLGTAELAQARTALNWAASTYVVAALSAIATLLYFLAIARNNR